MAKETTVEQALKTFESLHPDKQVDAYKKIKEIMDKKQKDTEEYLAKLKEVDK